MTQLAGARGDILLKTNQVELLSLFAHVAVHADGVRRRVEFEELRLRLSLRSFFGEIEADILHCFRFVLSFDSVRSLCAQILAQQQHQLQRSRRERSRKIFVMYNSLSLKSSSKHLPHAESSAKLRECCKSRSQQCFLNYAVKMNETKRRVKRK